MSKRPKLRLSRLRDIGWSIWDPIGLNDFGEDWKNVSFASEYDGYLIRAAGMLRNNEPEENVVDYLVHTEIDRMGLPPTQRRHERARAVVSAIKNDKQIWSDIDP